MTRQELFEAVKRYANDIVALFDCKNNFYGSTQNAFYNFEETAKRVWGLKLSDVAFKVLLTYMDKHVIALCNGGISLADAKERLADIAVYALISMAMVEEEQKKQAGK